MSFLYNTPDYDKLPPVTPMHIILLREKIARKQEMSAAFYQDATDLFDRLPFVSDVDKAWIIMNIDTARLQARDLAEDAMVLLDELMATEADEACYQAELAKFPGRL